MNKGAEKSNLPIMLSTDYKAEKKGGAVIGCM